MGALLRDPWFIYGFAHFSFLLMPAAALLVADGQRRASRAGWLVLPYFALGILPLSLYLALRPASEHAQASLWSSRVLTRRNVWIVCIGLNVIALLALLPLGSWAQLQAAMRQGFGWWFMWLDIPLNHLFVLPLAQAHMRHTQAPRQGLWLAVIALSGPFGLNAYMASRSSKTSTPTPYARPTSQTPR